MHTRLLWVAATAACTRRYSNKKKRNKRKKRGGKTKHGHGGVHSWQRHPQKVIPLLRLPNQALRPRQSWAEELQLEGSGPDLVLRLTRERDLVWDFYFCLFYFSLSSLLFLFLSCGRMSEGLGEGGEGRAAAEARHTTLTIEPFGVLEGRGGG